MSRKSTLNASPTIGSTSGIGGDMSQSSITSKITDIQYLDSISIQLSWTGSPVGSFEVQGSIDYSPGDVQSGRPANSGTWTPMTLSYLDGSTMTTDTSIPTTVGSPILLNLALLAFPYIKIVYTRDSGSGTLSAWIMGKAQ